MSTNASFDRLLAERIWCSDVLDSTEHFRLVSTADGFRLEGRTAIAYRDEQVRLDYQVGTTTAWETMAASISIAELGIGFEVEVDSGAWIVNGRTETDLDGCVDIDLGWTPATNTLPIRRIGAEIGLPITTRAAWLRWPDLVFAPADQTYTKRNETQWTYEQTDFKADLVVDHLGVVVTYGKLDSPIWHQMSS